MRHLINEDCITWAINGTIPEKMDLVFADPPFNLGKEYETPMSEQDYLAWCSKWIEVGVSLLAPNGAFWLMTRQPYVGHMMLMLEKMGLHFRDLIVWLNSSMPVKHHFCIGWQPLLWYVKNLDEYTFNYGAERRESSAAIPWGRKNNAGSIKDVWDDIPFVSGGCIPSKQTIFRSGTKRKAHPAQMPLGLSDRIVKYCTNPGDTVVDLFAGSATMGVSCTELNRHYYGLEKHPGYHELALWRMRHIETYDPRGGPYEYPG